MIANEEQIVQHRPNNFKFNRMIQDIQKWFFFSKWLINSYTLSKWSQQLGRKNEGWLKRFKFRNYWN